MNRAAQSHLKRREDGTRTRKKILVVDEDLMSIVNICQTLLRGGYVLSHATNHQTALKAIGDEKPDLIICNLDGQDLEADQLVSTVHQTKAFRSIPFLLIVESKRDTVQAPEILGPKQYLIKPFTREQLASAVQEHLDRKRQRQIN